MGYLDKVTGFWHPEDQPDNGVNPAILPDLSFEEKALLGKGWVRVYHAPIVGMPKTAWRKAHGSGRELSFLEAVEDQAAQDGCLSRNLGATDVLPATLVDKIVANAGRAAVPVRHSSNVHVIVEVKGKDDKVELFHALLAWIDGDWPWRATAMQYRVCKVCKGRVWSRPKLGPADIKAGGRQIGVKVKVMRYAAEDKCFPAGVVAEYNVVEKKAEWEEWEGGD